MLTKVTLHNDEHDELELGPFTLGVVIEDDTLIDIASGATIATQWRRGIWVQGKAFTSAVYSKVFIQAVEESEMEPKYVTFTEGPFENRSLVAPADAEYPSSIHDVIDIASGRPKAPWRDLR